MKKSGHKLEQITQIISNNSFNINDISNRIDKQDEDIIKTNKKPSKSVSPYYLQLPMKHSLAVSN